MKISNLIRTLVVSAIFYPSISSAAIDDNAPTVQVLKSCIDSGGSTIDNCFTDTWELTNWMKNTRKPNSSSPLKVNIGPGDFDSTNHTAQLKMICNPSDGYTGHTHFEGAGALVTILRPGAAPIGAKNCTQLEFSSFKIVTSYHYMFWRGGGESRWYDMEVETAGGVWSESLCASERGKHYWYSSRLSFGSTGGGTGYTATCDETWFYGSEISLNDSFFIAGGAHALHAESAGEIHVYGGNISAIGYPGSTAPDHAMIKATGGGKIHIHGTGIDLTPSATATDDMAILYAGTGSMIHANSNAYAVKFNVGSASISRIIENGGSVVAPYDWGALVEPPALAGSKTGSDVVIETDCGATCDNTGSSIHTLIYDASCSVNPGGAWRDTVTNSCRGL